MVFGCCLSNHHYWHRLKVNLDRAVQGVSIHYKSRYNFTNGGGCFEPLYAWYGDMELLPHICELLSMGPVTVEITFHAPTSLRQYSGDRKLLTKKYRSHHSQWFDGDALAIV